MLIFLVFRLTHCYLIEYIPEFQIPPTQRQHPSMSSDSNSLIVFGGSYEGFYSNEVWKFSILDRVWEQNSISTNTAPAKRVNAGSFTTPDYKSFCIFAGLGEKGPLQDLWCYKIDGLRVSVTQWYEVQTSGEIPSPRYRFGYTQAKFNGTHYFFLFGGVTAFSYTDLFG